MKVLNFTFVYFVLSNIAVCCCVYDYLDFKTSLLLF